MELRCDAHLHGVLVDGLVEVKCRWKPCAEKGVVVLHYFDPLTGELVKTKRFREPQETHRKESQHAAGHDPAAVRTP